MVSRGGGLVGVCNTDYVRKVVVCGGVGLCVEVCECVPDMSVMGTYVIKMRSLM